MSEQLTIEQVEVLESMIFNGGFISRDFVTVKRFKVDGLIQLDYIYRRQSGSYHITDTGRAALKLWAPYQAAAQADNVATIMALQLRIDELDEQLAAERKFRTEFEGIMESDYTIDRLGDLVKCWNILKAQHIQNKSAAK